jgi:ribosomal protein S12 methylthiotransferase accessory factor
MAKIILKDAYKVKTQDQDKTLPPADTLSRFRERLQAARLDILEETRRVDNGRLDIPVFFSVCGEDARELIGNRKQMGKGGAPDQAEASAVMELAERFSFYAYRNTPENFIHAPRAVLGDNAMDLEEIAKSVHDTTPDVDKALALFAQTPMRWCPATDFALDREILIPFDWFFLINEFNGASAGNCPEEGLLQGVCEVLERHVSALVCQKQAAVPAIRPESAKDPMAVELLEKFRRAGILVHINDFTLGTGVPTVGVLAYDPQTLGVTSEIVWTAGTAPSPEKALCRALTETAQLAGDFNSGSNYVASGLPKFRLLDDAAYILFSDSHVNVQDLPDISDSNMRTEFDRAVQAMRNAGMRAVSVDTIHPALQIPTFYTVAPGARFRERAAASGVGLFLSRLVTENEPPPVALARLARMERELPGRYYLPFYQGIARLQMEEPDKALLAFQLAESRGPHPEDAPAVLVYQGMALKEMEDYAKAAAPLKAALELDPERTDAWNLLGFCHFKQKEHIQAIECFERVIELNPASAIDYANIASNYRDLGDRERAAEYYRQALRLDTSLGFAAENLRRLTGEGE